MSIPHGFALDFNAATSIELPAGAAGAYGAPQTKLLDPGLYYVLCDAPVSVLDSRRETFRVGLTGNKLEVPVTPEVPLPMLLMRNEVCAAAKDTVAVVWFVPLVPVEEIVKRLRRCS